ncbi:MAG: acyltransferase [Bacteroidaceae bacterium]|nr:acyltransferase [Bacteroidaceae bacterium]
MANKERNHAFDLLCGICIIRMITLHVTGMCGHGGDDWWKDIMYWTFYFMSFFFFKAGYFNKTVSGNSKQYCIDKFKRLMIPYFVWGIIGCVVYFSFMPFLIHRYHHPVEPITWNHIWTTSYFWGNSPCWFLFSFFTAYIAMHFIEKVRGLHWLVLLFPFISYWMYTLGNPIWMSLNNVFMGIFFFFLGRIWHWALARLRRRNTFAISCALVAIFMVLNVLFHGEYTMSTNTWSGNPFMLVVNTAIALCGLSGMLLSLHIQRVPVINYIGQHSMVYFVLHYPLLIFYRFVHLSFGRSIFGRWDDLILLLVFIFAVCTWLVPYIEAVPWLSGRFKSGQNKQPDKTTRE